MRGTVCANTVSVAAGTGITRELCYRRDGQEGLEMEVTEMRFDNIMSAVEFAEENIKEGFKILRQEDGTYIVREVDR